jgi:hypothetical protein
VPDKINRVHRRAAGQVCLALFGTLNATTHAVRNIARADERWGTGKGLTDKEREYVIDLATRLHKEGERLRMIGWRLMDS